MARSFLKRPGPVRSMLAIVKGMAITFKHLFRKPVTVQYPFEKVPMYLFFSSLLVCLRLHLLGQRVCDLKSNYYLPFY